MPSPGFHLPLVKERARKLLLFATPPVALTALLAFVHIPYVSALARVFLAATCLLILLWLGWRLYRAFLYKVGRRLAFSYFLLGVLPIPLLLLLLAVLTYLLSGFFLGHLYRDAVQSVQLQVDSQARSRLDAFVVTRSPGSPGDSASDSTVVFGYYRDGRRIGGDRRTPAAWPAWAQALPQARTSRWEVVPRFVVPAGGGSPTLMAITSREGLGVVALYASDLDLELSQRAEAWVETYRSDDPDLKIVSLQLGTRRIPLHALRRDQQAADAAKFFRALSRGQRFWDDPVLWWGEISGTLYDLETGKVAAEYLAANLNATPRTVVRHLFASAAEIDTFAWVMLFIVAFLLFDVYAAAAFMAIFMIVGLSRAVNRMSRATEAVRQGDFSVRIPVKRRDQVGDLQRSFNEMAGNLETLVATSAQKELLEKELELARNLQKSLLPSDLPAGGGIEFATLFEPSAAIGGDYFDVLRLSEDELAVIIADVSGHGLSSGLRMAMLKAALLILVEETREPAEILRRLDGVVRSNGESRFFVTATLGLFHLKTGVLRLTNAGHPPTYIVRGSDVEEILLPSSPLGGLGHYYASATTTLGPGESAVFLSDGLIEATNAADEPFGYDSVVRVLAGRTGEKTGESAADILNRLLIAIERHTAGHPAGDDRTLMVLRYGGSHPYPQTH
ncbi:MAG: phosphoserine phosphatase RsbU/P [Acidobacteriota bacterium]|jgi:sigma-B regulation protein RsbU (phosphoserine phosphatase)|nr:phosphoserine phosphatase RsbU/P [Acidobacteriota bacterium]